MVEIFLKTLPFFALMGIGYWAGWKQFFTKEATGYLTKFVFYFALSAMLFHFSANLQLSEVWDVQLILAYLFGTIIVYALASIVGYFRGLNLPTIAIEAQCAVIGNAGFLGIPMLAMLFGPKVIGPVMLVLATDLIIFSSLVVILITIGQGGHMSFSILKKITLGLASNPMIAAMSLGLFWSVWQIPIPDPMNEFLSILGGAATPGALFAIGASLASKSSERIGIASWLSFCKLILHPIAVAMSAIYIFDVEPFSGGLIIACAAMPVAGNIYMLAQHYDVAPLRVSATILLSTVISILTLTAVIAWIS